MVGFSKPGETTADKLSNGKSSDSSDDSVDSGGTPEGVDVGPTVDMAESEDSLTRPEFPDQIGDGDGVDSDRLEELEAENEELREMVEQQREAISDLAEKMEILGEIQADVIEADLHATIQLQTDAYGDMHTVTLVPGLEYD